MPLWRDFKEKSVMTVIFDVVVSGEVWALGPNRWGVTTHPWAGTWLLLLGLLVSLSSAHRLEFGNGGYRFVCGFVGGLLLISAGGFLLCAYLI